MRKIYTLIFTIIALGSKAQTYHLLSGGTFSQNWTNTSLITVNDNWSNVPSMIGYRGDDLVTLTGVDPQTILAAGTTTPVNVLANQGVTATNGGLLEIDQSIANPTIAIQGSGTADAPFLLMFINTTGITGVRVKYLLRDLDASADNSTQPIALQYRIGNTGDFTNIPAAFVADASGGPSLATLETQVNIVLPAACNNQAELQLRIITGNATGSDEWIGIDDIDIRSSDSDVTPPVISTLNPANGATNLLLSPLCTITFSEAVQKGTGNILIKRFSDNTTVQTFDVTSAAVSVSGSAVSFTASLIASTQYYVEMDAGAFKDLANNNFAGITGNSTWSFSTGTGAITNYKFDFNSCTIGGAPGNNFSQFSVTGDSVWKCTSFGFGGTNGTQITGFSVAQGALLNEDWLISPALNLTGFDVPLLQFRSRTRFAGLSLKLFVSTNYSGSGNPNTATWTEINGRFPELNSDVWTLSDSINLNNFKSAATYLAWVYYSNPSAGAARWTLDNVEIYTNSVAPQATLTISNGLPKLINFGIVTNGNTSAPKQFSFWANEVSGNLTVTVPAGFEISKDNTSYNASVTYTNTELNSQQSPFVRFKPTAADAGFGGTLSFAASNLNRARVDMNGSSLDKSKSLDVVNWNLTWFGGTSNPPTNEQQQMLNAIKVMDSLDADIYLLQEIVDTARLGTVTRALKNGPYSYIVSLFGSGAPDNTSGNWPTTQKLAYIYRSNMFSNIRSRAYTSTSTNPNNNFNWSSGRFPFLMEADVTVDGVSKRIAFFNIHAKADLGVATDYQRRKAGADLMADSLNAFYPTQHFLIAGDYNDDLDFTISTVAGTSATPYTAFTNNGASYSLNSLWASLRGDNSYIGQSDVIDHCVTSNDMNQDYHAFSSMLVTEAVNWVNAYRDSLTDHIPLLTRFNLRQSNTNLITTSVRNIIRDGNYIKLLGNPSAQPVVQFGKNIAGDVQLRVMSSNGQVVWEKRMSNVLAGQIQPLQLQLLPKGVYTLVITSREGIYSEKVLR
ncbi:Ig-like domain-containing protein [Lacibacter sp. MH-610]|uniref:Ig-like domain-containing protein n=1 Tax=Lacibacter sp. MH-610 TaxID=3020883 RepID=UPI00389135DF